MSHLVSEEVKNMILTSTPEQVAAITDFIKFAQSTTPQTSQVKGKQHDQSLMRKKSKSAVASRKRVPKPSAQMPGVVVAAKRPLNSWMGFRCYYAIIFTSYQQKDISGFLTKMWQDDPFKAKWTIVAKAYSVIRDQVGKQSAPLDQFLLIVCPLIGIIDPASYLDFMGWALPKSMPGTITRNFTPDISLFDPHLRTTNLSVEDLVKHCEDIGYVSIIQPVITSTEDALTMVASPAIPEDFNQAQTGYDMAAFNPSFADEFAPAAASLPFADNSINDIALANSGDSYPYDNQFEPEDFSSGLGLHFDGQEGDQFDAISFSADFDTEAFISQRYQGHYNRVFEDFAIAE